MKRSKALIVLGTILLALAIVAFGDFGTRSNRHAALELTAELDTLHGENMSQLTNLIRQMVLGVVESGMRPKDMQVIVEARKVYTTSYQLLTGIESLKRDSHTALQDMDQDSLYSLMARYGELRDLVDSVLNSDYAFELPPALVPEDFCCDEADTRVALTAMESEIIGLTQEFIDHQSKRVGTADMRFSIPPGKLFAIKVDSSELSLYQESYAQIHENPFQEVAYHPLSTFSVDVDKAAYANVRRYLEMGILPPPDAVRIEELINYFEYEYPQPKGDDPISINTTYAACPWNEDNRLLHIGLKGKDLTLEQPFDELPPNNLTFLIDVSGSMGWAENKLPLVQSSLKILTEKMRPQDKVAIVVYAGAAGVVLPATNDKKRIVAALDKLEAGGSTAGGEGIALAYKISQENFIPDGNNRVIIATDGDFNVGPSSDADMFRLIRHYRDSGIYLTCLGFGMGNYKDSKMEVLADNGNGNYAYIDSKYEADYILGTGFAGTLYTIAKDVKIQIEFNPSAVESYRLIGYENRLLMHEDFENDEVDAGDIGSGHTVTALYEIVPAGGDSSSSSVLKYQQTNLTEQALADEVATVKFRYKHPESKVSKEVVTVVGSNEDDRPDANFALSSAVAEYGLLLRDSKHKGTANFEQLVARVRKTLPRNKDPRWNEFMQLSTAAKDMEPLSMLYTFN